MASPFSVKLYTYSKCSTCRRAISWLENRNIEFQKLDIVTTPPSKDTLKKALSFVQERKLLFNTHGVSYRNLGASKIKSMKDAEALEALSSDGKLIKRPLLVLDDSYFLTGFNVDAWHELFDKIQYIN